MAVKTENIVSIYKRFPTEDSCLAHIEQVRWKGRPACPYCTSDRITKFKSDWRYHCNACNTSFSVTVNTIFHHTHMDLQKWFLAVALMLNAKKGISARQLARDIDVNKNTGWYVNMRIRRAMAEGPERELLQGICEMDETYVGGKPRKGGPPQTRGRGTKKQPVVGIIERGGKVRAVVAKREQGLTAKRMETLVRQNIAVSESTVYTDQFSAYFGLKRFVKHGAVDHTVCYADGEIHTNSIESFWALLKRGIVGQYHKVSVRHLPQYLNEFCYRFNNRKNADVFDVTLCRALGV